MNALRRIASAQLARVEQRFAERVAGDALLSQRWSPQTKIAQVTVKHEWMESSLRPFPLESSGFRVFSQFEEDGLILAVFAILGEGQRTFVDLGAADGINSNCANLAINHGWWGLHVDGDENAISRGMEFAAKHPDLWVYPPKYVCTDINRESINKVIEEAGLSGEIDFLSIDIDGNDYWVWHALEQVQPRVVMIETHVEFGLHNVVVPYDASYRYPGMHPEYHGASLPAMEAMATQKGYRLVGSNFYGFNTIWIREDKGIEAFPAVSVEWALRHRRNPEIQNRFAQVASRPFVRGGTGFPGAPVEIDISRL